MWVRKHNADPIRVNGFIPSTEKIPNFHIPYKEVWWSTYMTGLTSTDSSKSLLQPYSFKVTVGVRKFIKSSNF